MPTFASTLDSLRTAARIPGLSAAVVKDGEVIFARGFGYADLERQVPATPETPYDIASVTKPISAVVALRLVEDGLLDLDRPMAQYSSAQVQQSSFAQAFFCAFLVAPPNPSVSSPKRRARPQRTSDGTSSCAV